MSFRLLLATLIFGLAPAAAVAEAPESGEEVELVWTDLRGRPMDPRDLRERIVVINFWATWCKPCTKEMPDLVKLHDRFAPYGVAFIGAAADSPEHVDAVIAYVRKHKINFPIGLGATTHQMEGLGLPPSLPGTVVLDGHGHPAQRYPGVIDPDKLEAALSSMLGLAGAKDPGEPVKVAQAEPHSHAHTTQASLVPS